MAFERTLLVSILKLAKLGPIKDSIVSKDSRLPQHLCDNALNKLANQGLILKENRVIEASSDQRIKIAIQAIKLGADFEKVCRFLDWGEFENFTVANFETNSFTVKRGFRFTESGRRWEIDILGFKGLFVACVDCKHWHHGWRTAATIKTVDAHLKRTKALANAMPRVCARIGLKKWEETVLIPLILSLYPSPLKFYKKTPIVPILQLQDFLSEFITHLDKLAYFSPSQKKIG